MQSESEVLNQATGSTPEQRFDEAFRVADEVRQKVLALLEETPQTDSQRRPASDEWSVGEIAHHLVLVEKSFPERILAIIATGREGEFNQQAVASERPIPLKDTADVKISGKGKAREATQPTPGLSLKELSKQLCQLRTETKSKLLPYRSRDLGNLWAQHPRFGPMTLYERICLLGYHEQKHLSQMQRAAAAL